MMTADQIERRVKEVGYGLLDIAACGDDSDDGTDAAGALGAALLQRLAESGVL